MALATQINLARDFLSLTPNIRQQSSSEPLYTPLDNARNEIRLLRIASCCDRDSSLRMFKYSLDDRPEYVALSYVWGDPKDTRPIRVNERDVQVTKNLADALLQLQQDERVLFLWVDALCINQADDEEKSVQVQKMGQIFSAAGQVVGWLGIGSEEDRAAMRMLKLMSGIASSVHIRHISDPAHWGMSAKQQSKVIRTIIRPLCADPRTYKGAIASILHFMGNPYWERIWIIQEINMATSAALLCGSIHIMWDTVTAALGVLEWLNFSRITMAFENDSLLMTELFSPMQPHAIQLPAAVRLHATFELSDRTGVALDNMLKSTCYNQDLQCAVPHDRIYALLGLMTAEDRESVKVDYHLPYTELCTEVTVRLLQQFGPSILMYCEPQGQASQKDLPTWAVDWTKTGRKAQDLLARTMIPVKELAFHVRRYGPSQIGMNATIGDTVTRIFSHSESTQDLLRVIDEFAELVSSESSSERLVGLGEARRSAIRTVMYLVDEKTIVEQMTVVERMLSDARGVNMPPPSGREDDRGEVGSADLEAASADSSKGRRPHMPDPDQLLLWNKCPRTLYFTEHGCIGSGPPNAQIGDVLCSSPESPFPFLIRPHHCGDDVVRWKLVGSTWVDGMITWEPDKKPYEYNMREFWETERKMEEIILT
jgi:hypothetical protein